MALKSNFEDANFISSPFVDEVANPGDLNAEGLANDKRKLAAEFTGAKSLRNLVNPIAGGKALKRKRMLRKRIKERKIAAELREERDR